MMENLRIAEKIVPITRIKAYITLVIVPDEADLVSADAARCCSLSPCTVGPPSHSDIVPYRPVNVLQYTVLSMRGLPFPTRPAPLLYS